MFLQGKLLNTIFPAELSNSSWRIPMHLSTPKWGWMHGFSCCDQFYLYADVSAWLCIYNAALLYTVDILVEVVNPLLRTHGEAQTSAHCLGLWIVTCQSLEWQSGCLCAEQTLTWYIAYLWQRAKTQVLISLKVETALCKKNQNISPLSSTDLWPLMRTGWMYIF